MDDWTAEHVGFCIGLGAAAFADCADTVLCAALDGGTTDWT